MNQKINTHQINSLYPESFGGDGAQLRQGFFPASELSFKL
jgi:hypothetical protein